MATSLEHQARYAALRNAVLTRHVAGGRFFRHDLLAEETKLGDAADCWSITESFWENPLLYGANLLTALGVEHALGSPHALSVIERIVASMAMLYRCTTAGFEGYPTRWDPATSDLWDTAPDGSLARNRHFLQDQDGTFLTSVPTTDPRAVPYRVWDTLRQLQTPEQFTTYRNKNWWFQSFHRRWEVSLDEVVGFVASYAVLHDLVTGTSSRVTALQTSVSDQAGKLADWLSRHGYLLVRPNGGFCARGPAGMAPACEHPFRVAFTRMTGMDAPARTDIVGALDAAGVWPVLSGPVTRIMVAGTIGTVIAAAAVGALIAELGPLGTALLGTVGLVSAGAATGAIARHPAFGAAVAQLSVPEIWRSVSLLVHGDCFDVWHYADEARWKATGPQDEFAIASALTAIEHTPTRFSAALAALIFAPQTNPANGFPPFLAVAGISDPTVRSSYLDWFDTLNDGNAHPRESTGPHSAFSAAVALTIDPTTSREQELLRRLDAIYADSGADLPTGTDENGRANEGIGSALDYMAALALAWRHTRSSSVPTIAGFPEPPAAPDWRATVPVVVLDAHPALRETIANPTGTTTGDIDVFGPDAAVRTASVTAPLPAAGELLFDGHLLLPRSHTHDFETGISLRWGDEWEFQLVRTTGRGIGAEGSELIDDARYPLHIGLDPANARRRAVLARLGGYVYVGTARARERWLWPWDDDLTPLFLRVNDPRAAGRGRFIYRCRIWGHRALDTPGSTVTCVTRMPRLLPSGAVARDVVRIGGLHADGTPWHVSLPRAVSLIEDNGHTFVVPGSPAQPLRVVRVTRNGVVTVHLRTQGDTSSGNDLAHVPKCPHVFP